ncbi:MAG: DUF434 domain-containing protein [Bacteroidales bacterium]|jgi:hypothetical protein
MNSGLLNDVNFEKGLLDYFYLIDRDYPEKGALKLVGDRHRISKELRIILYRGVSSRQNSVRRARRLVKKPSGRLIIDGYNILLTLLNYRLGHFVFISTDSICRDAGSLFGKIKKDNFFSDCLTLLMEYLNAYRQVEFDIYLDSPVPSSKKHKKKLSEIIATQKLPGNVHAVDSADLSIKDHHEGTIATSDSAIIDQTLNPVLDIPRQIIESKYNTRLYDIGSKLNLLSRPHL